jgi:hypothetical protein
MRKKEEEVFVTDPIELLDNLDNDLNRIEMWTAALSSFQRPAPEYQPGNVISDQQEGAGQRHRQSYLRPPKFAHDTAPALGGAVRNTIEKQPYTAVAIALGLGLLLGRLHRPL